MRRAARRRDVGDHKPVLRRVLGRVGVAIWRRAAATLRFCLPEPTIDELSLPFGAEGAAGDDVSDGDDIARLPTYFPAAERSGMRFSATSSRRHLAHLGRCSMMACTDPCA